MAENAVNGTAGSDQKLGSGAIGLAGENSGNAGTPRPVDFGTGSGAQGGAKPARRPGESGEKRGRGRPAGSKTGSGQSEEKPPSLVKPPSKPVDIDGLTLALQNTCAILSGVAKCPELELDSDEAKQVAAAYANVARHYNFSVNEKAADWYNLMTVCGAVFGSKIIAIRMRKKSEKPSTQKPVFAQPQREATPSQARPAPAKAPPPPQMAMSPAEPDMSENLFEG